MNRRKLCLGLSFVALSAQAFAFDLGPHVDMTANALLAEGFSETASLNAQVRTALTYLHGCGDEPLLPGIEAAKRLQFDSQGEADYGAEWSRLSRATREGLRSCAKSGDAEGALAVLGASLYAVQEFYGSSNWTERAKTLGRGSHPTWFDVPSGRPSGIRLSRVVGSDSQVAALIASQQWVRAARVWTANEGFWRKVMAFSSGEREGKRFLGEAWRLAAWNGKWRGGSNGRKEKPAIDDSVLTASPLAAKWRWAAEQVAVSEPPEAAAPVLPSGSFVPAADFFEITLDRFSRSEPDPAGKPAEWYARARIADLDFLSCLHLQGVGVPTSFVRMLPRERTHQVPLSSVRVTLKTGMDERADTDMRLFLRINEATRYDFYLSGLSRGSTRSFVFVPHDVLLDQLRFIQIEKVGGGDWLMSGITVEVNGEEVYRGDGLNVWFRQVNQVWRVPSFRGLSRYTTEVPIKLELWDGNWLKEGMDRQADIHPNRGRSFLYLLFNPGTSQIRLDAAGKSAASSKGAGDQLPSEVGFKMRMIDVRPPGRSSSGP